MDDFLFVGQLKKYLNEKEVVVIEQVGFFTPFPFSSFIFPILTHFQDEFFSWLTNPAPRLNQSATRKRTTLSVSDTSLSFSQPESSPSSSTSSSTSPSPSSPLAFPLTPPPSSSSALVEKEDIYKEYIPISLAFEPLSSCENKDCCRQREVMRREIDLLLEKNEVFIFPSTSFFEFYFHIILLFVFFYRCFFLIFFLNFFQNRFFERN